MEKGKSIMREKSFSFAINIVKLCQRLSETNKEYVLSKQLLRSGTAIGALIREAQNAESLKDFIHKLAIAQKECDETMYWLEILQSTNYISQSEFELRHTEATELYKMIKSAIITSKEKLHKM